LFRLYPGQRGRMRGTLPYIGGDCPGYLMNMSAADCTNLFGELRFGETPNLATTGGTTNRCSIGSADGYVSRDTESGEKFAIFGTGNLNRVLQTSANYAVTDNDGVEVVEVDATGGNRTITLPTAADNEGRVITVKKIDAGGNNVILDGEGAETIDGAANITWAVQFESHTVISNGTSWSTV
jgi:hypothetical protein